MYPQDDFLYQYVGYIRRLPKSLPQTLEGESLEEEKVSNFSNDAQEKRRKKQRTGHHEYGMIVCCRSQKIAWSWKASTHRQAYLVSETTKRSLNHKMG